MVFPVEIRIGKRSEDALTARMTAMREWLDRCRFEPSTFRYTFASPGLVFRADFATQAEAAAFATEFDGRMIAISTNRSSQAAD